MSELKSASSYRFGPFELNAATRSLLKDGEAISLRPRAFDVLLALVERAGQLSSKDELFERVWPKAVVEEAALNVQISALRKVLGAGAITTVSGRGYQFTWPVAAAEAVTPPEAKPPHNLPNALTGLVGRDEELAQLSALVPMYRLVTLTGVGGVGKTRLAVEAARGMLKRFPDGVWLVELDALSDPALVPKATAQALGVTEQPGRSIVDTLIEDVAGKKILLVLDNAEHLLAACAALASLMLRRCADIALLVTSRERLSIAGERSFQVPSLGVPPVDVSAIDVEAYTSVRLFVERAQLIRPDAKVTPGDAPLIASICARLDGLPLAIELAASRLRALSVNELSDRLHHRFALLKDSSTLALPRQRTMQAVLDWSYELLGEPDRAMLRRTAVFAGGWTLDSAEHVCADDNIAATDILDRLTSLVDKSLVVTEERAGSTRYRMLETVRHYAMERLSGAGDEAKWRTRHLAWISALAEAFYQGSQGPEGNTWFARIDREFDNLRAAVAWAVDSNPGAGLRLTYHARAFLVYGSHVSEGQKWLSQLLDVFPADGPALDRARALHAAATLATAQGDDSAAERQMREGLALFRAVGDLEGSLRALSLLGNVTLDQGRYIETEVLAREALERAQELGNSASVHSSRAFLGVALHGLGRWAEAHESLQQVLETERGMGRRANLVWVLNEIGLAECREGRPDLALQRFVEGATIAMDLGVRGFVIDALEGIAGVAAATGAPTRAAQLWGAVDALRLANGNRRSIRKSLSVDRQVQEVRENLAPGTFDRAWTQGRAMSLDEAVRLALTQQAHPSI